MRLSGSLFLLATAPLLGTSAVAASLADFTKCISAQGQGSVCQLDAGTYQLSLPLVIGRSNITVKGTIHTSLADTTLQRGPGSTRALMASYPQNPNLTSITVRDFTFDGAGNQQRNSSVEDDVRFVSVTSLLLTNAAFFNSPNVALTLEGAIGQATTSGAVINNISVDNAASLGIWAYADAGPVDGPGKYLTCGSLVSPSDIKISNSTFTNVGANAIALEATGVQVTNNILRHNHDTAPYNAPGGQIFIQICADDVALVNNVVSDGPATANGWFAEGLELHGINLVVVNNTITNNAGSGIAMSGVQNVFIANWTSGTGVISNNLVAGNLAGVSLYNAAPGDTNERQVDAVTVDHAVAIDGHKAGIGIFLQTGQTNPINHVTLTNNCLSGNLKGPTSLFGLGPDVLIANNSTSSCPQ